MFLCFDVHYQAQAATTAGVAFNDAADAVPAWEFVTRSDSAPAPYQPGEFYRRELPQLQRAVEEARRRARIERVIIDGHVWLSEGRPGLGAHLYQALEGSIPIIGVAKTRFHGGVALPVFRGQSRQPLWITAAGLDAEQAAAFIGAMHGPHRLPTLLKRADSLARGWPGVLDK